MPWLGLRLKHLIATSLLRIAVEGFTRCPGQVWIAVPRVVLDVFELFGFAYAGAWGGLSVFFEMLVVFGLFYGTGCLAKFFFFGNNPFFINISF